MAIAFVETGVSSGSGVLIKGNFVLTNSHVVWPYDSVRVVFPDGTEFSNADVSIIDTMADLALIGPLDTNIAPLSLVDGESLGVGSAVYLIGYPAESEAFPQPTITQGIISNIREWQQFGMTYFQTDAAITGGQSGGVLASKDGVVIGISGFSRGGNQNFGLVASAHDIQLLLAAMNEGGVISDLGERRVRTTGRSKKHSYTLKDHWDSVSYAFYGKAGDQVQLKIKGEHDGVFVLFDSVGLPVGDGTIDMSQTGVEATSVVLPHYGIYFLVAFQFDESPGEFELEGSVALTPQADPDDRVVLSIGKVFPGNIDYPADFDTFLLKLEKNEIVEIRVDSPNIDSVLVIDFEGSRDTQVIEDDNSGKGISGGNAQMVYRAPHKGTYLVIVRSKEFGRFGGYYLTVEKAEQGATPVTIPGLDTIDSRYGPMLLYESAAYPFSIQYPADLEEVPEQRADITAIYAKENVSFVIAEESFVINGREHNTRQFADLVEKFLTDGGYKIFYRKGMRTTQGLQAELIEYEIGQNRAVRFMISVQEEEAILSATFIGAPEEMKAMRQTIEYVYSTFKVER